MVWHLVGYFGKMSEMRFRMKLILGRILLRIHIRNTMYTGRKLTELINAILTFTVVP
jgi:hypothetical protein